MCSCKSMYVEARGVLWKLFHRSHVLFFLEARFLIGLEPRSRPGWTHWLASGFQGSDCFLLFSAGFVSRHSHTCVSKWVVGIKLGPSWSRFRHGAGAVSLPWLPSPLFSCLYLLEALVSLTFSTLGGLALSSAVCHQHSSLRASTHWSSEAHTFASQLKESEAEPRFWAVPWLETFRRLASQTVFEISTSVIFLGPLSVFTDNLNTF